MALAAYSDFQKLDLRVGKIEKAELLVGSKNLIRLGVNFGNSLGDKKIISGIAKWYKPAALVGKKAIFIFNLEPKQMMEEMSEGMVLCADTKEKPLLIWVNKNIPEGTVIR